MPAPSQSARSMPRSGIRRIFDLAATIPDAIHLEVGQPDFATPAHVVEAAHDAMVDGFTGYTPNAGIPELRECLTAKLWERNKIDASPDQIVVTAGGGQGLFSIFLALVDRGDEVLAPDPGWPNAAMQIHLAGGALRRYPLGVGNGFVPDVDDLERVRGTRTRVLLINSPANPTGAVTAAARLREILEWAELHDLWVVSDECYDEIVFDGAAASLAEFDISDRVLTVFSFSKTYAMTGWRVGYVVSPPDLAPTLAKLQEPVVSCVFGATQKAAVAALTGPQDAVETMREAYRTRRDQVMAVLAEGDVPAFRPQGAFYVWVDVSSSGSTSEDFALRLIGERHVAVVPGTAFGPRGEGWVRVSLATATEPLLEGVRRLAEATVDLAGTGPRPNA